MKITVNTMELKNVVEKLFKALPKKQDDPIMDNFCIEVESSRSLLKVSTMCCEDDVIINAAVAKVEIEVEQGITDARIILSNTTTFVKAFKFFKDEHTSLEFNDPTTLVMRCGNKTSKLDLLAVNGNYPEFPEIAIDNAITYNTGKLKQRFNKIKHAIPKNTTDNYIALRGVHFNGADIVACDGCRIAVSTDESMTLDPITIPQNEMNTIFEIFKGEDIVIGQYREYFVAMNNTATFIAKKVQREYIDYKKIFSAEARKSREIKINKDEFIEGLGYLNATTGSNNKKGCCVEMCGKVISTTNHGSTAQVEMDCDEIPFTILYNPTYMLDALKQFDEDCLILNVISPYSSLIIKNETNAALVLPIRKRW